MTARGVEWLTRTVAAGELAIPIPSALAGLVPGRAVVAVRTADGARWRVLGERAVYGVDPGSDLHRELEAAAACVLDVFGGFLAPGWAPNAYDIPSLLREFVGFLTASVPELATVEVPALADHVGRFLAAKGVPVE